MHVIMFLSNVYMDYNVINDVKFCLLIVVTLLLHGHADGTWLSSGTTNSWFKMHNFCWSINNSDLSLSFSRQTSCPLCFTNRNRFISSWTPALYWDTWFFRSSKCFCFFIRDRLAESLFDIKRFLLRSFSIGLMSHWFVSPSSEPELELFGFKLQSLESGKSIMMLSRKLENERWSSFEGKIEDNMARKSMYKEEGRRKGKEQWTGRGYLKENY